MSEAHADTLIKKGISLFAFISAYQPGTPDETPFVEALKQYLGDDPKWPENAFVDQPHVHATPDDATPGGAYANGLTNTRSKGDRLTWQHWQLHRRRMEQASGQALG